MNALSLSSHAKINWVLRVHPPRPDGYHDLTTVFSEITLADQMDFSPREEPECTISGFFESVALEENVIYRAWLAVRAVHPEVGGLHVSVRKQIPMGGGLGGGSSNAASTIKALDKLYGLNMPLTEQLAIAASVGSDVPFFIYGGCCIGQGRGEILTPVAGALPVPMVLVMPGHGISTGEAFRRLDSVERETGVTEIDSVIHALRTADTILLAEAVVNDFDRTVEDEPWFRDISEALVEAGCIRALLCGSGSTVAGIAREHNQLESISARLNSRGIYNYQSASSLWS